MGVLSHTNIVVDDFSYGQANNCKNYIYFLSHMHSDHYQGLSNEWDFGPIYCSEITKRVLLNKWPKIQGVIGLELNKQYDIYLNKEKSLLAKVILFDANHIIGSVMFLFEGYFGKVMHTGDSRFDEYMLKDYTYLFPPALGWYDEAKEYKKSLPIDELILDNTYCDPVFQFPKRDKCVKDIIHIIDENKPCDVYISTYNLGKEEILLELATHYNTKVVVSEERFKDMLAMDVDISRFSTRESDGWIFVRQWKNKKTKEDLLRRGNKYIKITPTGWANIKDFIAMGEGEYIVPYSSHSNFREIEMFVGSIRPAVLKCVVRESRSNFQKTNNVQQTNSYMFRLQSLKQKGYQQLVEKYTSLKTASKQYLDLMDPQMQSQYEQLLGLKVDEATLKQEDSRRFDQSSVNVQILNARNKKKLSKGIRLLAPEENEELTQEDLQINQEHSRQSRGEPSRMYNEDETQENNTSMTLGVAVGGLAERNSNATEILDSTMEDGPWKKVKQVMYADRTLTGVTGSGAREDSSDEEREIANRRAFLAAKAQEKMKVPQTTVVKAEISAKDDFDEEFA